MRMAAAAATIAACVLVSFAVNAEKPASPSQLSRIVGASTPTRAIYFANQTPTSKPGAAPPAGNDSCRWANDNECDDPDIGTGACTQGTDYSDCRRIRQNREDDSCRWARDERNVPTSCTRS